VVAWFGRSHHQLYAKLPDSLEYCRYPRIEVTALRKLFHPIQDKSYSRRRKVEGADECLGGTLKSLDLLYDRVVERFGCGALWMSVT
jgi:hypothetical protein